MAGVDGSSISQSAEPYTALPFPAVTKHQILNCSYHSWHPRYRKVTPKARLIPLTAPFLSYLRADGILLPDDNASPPRDWSDDDSGIFSSSENPDAGEESDDEDPSAEWRYLHLQIKNTIEELGGKVVPKMNWSAPKDATWMNANSMECRTPSEIYLLLKSSDFITHDLEHAFDDTEEPAQSNATGEAQADPEIPYHLVLRKHFLINPSLEFRCFVRRRNVLAISQRDLNHFEFLFSMSGTLRSRITSFFDDNLRDTFPDENFVFDVYVPPPHDKVWLIDINPWAQRTDPLLFSWLELLTMDGPDSEKWVQKQKAREAKAAANVVSIPIALAQQVKSSPPSSTAASTSSTHQRQDMDHDDNASEASTITPSNSDDEDDDDADEEIWTPEIRLVKKDDPEAYSFASPQYSAHKLPRDVVDASRGGEGGMREFAEQWKEVLARAERGDQQASDSDADDE
ncbi:cell division cycle protein-like protein [Phyllosticta citrichinensis]|uniref:Cell division cycle protein-like protein n=1 Tax=Phyllosticta citrichinensis TaxID=1130410 RepID=A0ABR1XMK0_9PEZI